MNSETPAVIGRLVLTGVLVIGAITVLRFLRTTSETVANFDTPDTTEQTAEAAATTTTIPLIAEETIFGPEWVVSPDTTDNSAAAGSTRTAMYERADEIIVSVIADGAEFAFPELEQVAIGPVTGWVLVDPDIPNLTHISAVGEEHTTHLRIGGVDRDGAVAIAGSFFDQRASSTELPDKFGTFELLGESQPGTSASVASTAWAAIDESGRTVQLLTYAGETGVKVAEAELQLDGASVRIDGRYQLASAQYKDATVGWTLADGRFATLSSPNLSLEELNAIANNG